MLFILACSPLQNSHVHSLPVPSLFRLMLLNNAKGHKPIRNEIPAQRRDRRSCGQRQKSGGLG
jgi:hypothetical protein